MSSRTAPPAGPAALSGRLGAISVAFMVIAAAAPLTVVGGIIPVGLTIGNGLGFPTMFAVATGVLLLFAIGLMAMSRDLPHAGAFFTYISHGLGRTPGVAAAYLALACYTTVQAAVFAYFGAAVSGGVALMGGPDTPWWLWTLAGIAVVGLLGYRHIELSSKVLIVVLIAEMAIVLLLALVVLLRGGAEGLSSAPFTMEHILSGSPALGLMFALASFIGFESTVIYRNEVADPRRTLPRATYGSAIVIGVFYVIAGWTIIMGIGPSTVIATAAADPATLLARTTELYLGPVGSALIAVLLIGSMFAAVLSLHNVLTRYMHTLGGVGLLPRGLGVVHPKHVSPHRASLVQISCAVAFTLITAIFGLAPELAFAWFAGAGTLAIVVLMAATCLSVPLHFARTGQARGWARLVAPGLGFLGLAVAAAMIAWNFPLLVGDLDAEGQPAWGVVSVLLVSIVIIAPLAGIIRASVLRRRDPDAYASITATIEKGTA